MPDIIAYGLTAAASIIAAGSARVSIYCFRQAVLARRTERA